MLREHFHAILESTNASHGIGIPNRTDVNRFGRAIKYLDARWQKLTSVTKMLMFSIYVYFVCSSVLISVGIPQSLLRTADSCSPAFSFPCCQRKQVNRPF